MSISKTILKSTFSNWAGMLISTLVVIFLTPYVLKHLGDERYGIYQIVFPIIQYLILLELGLRASVVRFASKYIAGRNVESLNKVISTAFFVFVCASVVTVIMSAVFGLLAPRFFNISPEYHRQVFYIFLGLGFSTVFSFLSYGFGGVLIGHYRYDLKNLGLIINNICRAILVIAFFSLGWVSLSSWAMAIVLAPLIEIVFVSAACFYIQEGLSIRPKYINMVTFKELFGFGFWNMLMQLSGFITISTNPIVIGKYMGPEAVPYYAIPFMLVARMQAFVMGMTSTLLPMASSTLSSKNRELMRHLLRKGTYAASMLVFPLGGVLLVMCKSLFGVWLPAGYESSWVIYGILTIAYFGIMTQTASFFLLLGGGKIRGLAINYISTGLIVVLLSIIFVGYMNLGLIGAAIALVIPRFFCNLFQVWYACHQMELNLWRYIKQSYTRPILCSLPSVALGLLLVHYWAPRNLIFWVIEYFVALIPYGLFALTGVLDWPLREQIVTKLFGLLGHKVRDIN